MIQDPFCALLNKKCNLLILLYLHNIESEYKLYKKCKKKFFIYKTRTRKLKVTTYSY